MSLKSKIKHTFIAASISAGFLVTAPAMANIVGSMTLDITDGCFSHGATGATGCGNTDPAHLEYATGSFVFTDSLSALNPSTKDYSFEAFANLHAENDTTTFDDNRFKPFDSFLALTTDPLWATALAVFQTISSNAEVGSITAPASLGGFTISWENIFDPASTPTNASGTFTAWSDDDLNNFSQLLFNRALPLSTVAFAADARLSAIATEIPEPVSLALLGLGLFALVASRRQKRIHPA